ncbi:MAG: hypothetical protein ACREDO_02610, partial [Methyloceanibacter sp.]
RSEVTPQADIVTYAPARDRFAGDGFHRQYFAIFQSLGGAMLLRFSAQGLFATLFADRLQTRPS